MSATATETKPKLKKFRMLQGSHEQTNPKDPNYTEHFTVMNGKPLPIIESDKDLCKLFNVGGVPPKFEPVFEDALPPKQRTVLIDMNTLSNKPVQALIEFAQDNEIELDGKTDKKDVLAAIKTAMSA